MYKRKTASREIILVAMATAAAALFNACISRTVKEAKEIMVGDEERVRVLVYNDSDNPYSGIEVSRDVILACIQRCKNDLATSWNAGQPPDVGYDKADSAHVEVLELAVHNVQYNGNATLFRFKGTMSKKWSKITIAHRPFDGDTVKCQYEAAKESFGKIQARATNKRTPFTLRIDEVAGEEPSDSGAKDCRLNSDCPVGNYCQDGRCSFDCREDRDCEGGLTCNNQNGRCE